MTRKLGGHKTCYHLHPFCFLPFIASHFFSRLFFVFGHIPSYVHPHQSSPLTPSTCHRLPTSQHKAKKNFNFNNVRVVTILGGGLEGSMVVRGMAFGRDSEGAFLFCLPLFLPPLIILRVSSGNRHDIFNKKSD